MPPCTPSAFTPFYMAVVLAAVATGTIGWVVEVGLLRRVYRAPELYQLLATFALVLVISDVVAFVWGRENKTGPTAPGLAGSVRVRGPPLPPHGLALNVLGRLAAR